MGTVLLAMFAGTGNLLLDKYILAKQKMKLGDYIPLLFAFLAIITFATLPWLGSINVTLASSQQYIFYFVLMIMLAIIWNIFYYQGLQSESMVEFEMILMLTPLVTALMASLFYPEEYNPAIFGATMVGSIALFLSHIKKHHFQFNKYAIHLVLAVFLMAMEAMVQKELLNIYSPALLYAVRVTFLAFFFFIYYRPVMAHVHRQHFNLVFWTAILSVISMVGKFYGYQQIGITFTTLIFLLVPILSSWADALINKTPIRRRTVIAFTIILCCVLYAVLLR